MLLKSSAAAAPAIFVLSILAAYRNVVSEALPCCACDSICGDEPDDMELGPVGSSSSGGGGSGGHSSRKGALGQRGTQGFLGKFHWAHMGPLRLQVAAWGAQWDGVGKSDVRH